MAGRGRGRGRGSMSFNVESLGFGRGEALPSSSIEPPPLYPPLEFKPVPLIAGEAQDYLFALKQEFRRAAKESPYHSKPLDIKKDIDRYSDKYQLTNQDNGEWKIDWKRFPSELKIRPKKKTKLSALAPNIKKVKIRIKEDEIKKTLDKLEMKEATDDKEAEQEEDESGDKANKDDDDEAGGEELEEMDEDDFEDETDYNQTYFDNGDNYGLDEDDELEDGATF